MYAKIDVIFLQLLENKNIPLAKEFEISYNGTIP